MTGRPPVAPAGTCPPRTPAARHEPPAAGTYPDPDLLRLLCDDRASARRLLATLLEVTRADLSDLRRAAHERDTGSAEALLHRMLGGLATLGRCAAIDQGRRCLEALRSGRIAVDGDQLADLDGRLQALLDDLSARLDGDTVPHGDGPAARPGHAAA